MNNLNISYVGFERSQALETYLIEKLDKYSEELSIATKCDVFFKQSVHAKGVDQDFRLDINLEVPRARIRVEEVGADMYALVDKATDVLIKRVRRYSDKRKNWDGNTPWRVLEAQESLQTIEDSPDTYVNYIPKISVRKKLEDMSPMEEGEAIEKMELMGFKQMLFKNIKTGKISMLYKRSEADYGLVEPGDETSI